MANFKTFNYTLACWWKLSLAVPPAPQFRLQMLWVKWMKPDGASVHQAWDILALGSQSPSTLSIPPWTAEQGGFNFQIEATIKNVTSEPLSVLYRTQTCPKSLGGTYGGVPGPIPPCGQVVDSRGILFEPGATWLLPIWQLRMWSEAIREHNWIVDNGALDIGRLGTYYNIAFPWQNYGYRQDDWYIDVGVGTPTTLNEITFIVVRKSTQIGVNAAVHLAGPVIQDKVTNSFGLVSFWELPSGTYTATVTANGYEQATIANLIVPPNISRYLVELVPSGPQDYRVTVQVRNQAGMPVEGATVTLT